MVRREWRKFQRAAKDVLTWMADSLDYEEGAPVVEFMEDALRFYWGTEVQKVRTSRYYALQKGRFVPVDGSLEPLADAVVREQALKILASNRRVPRTLLLKIRTELKPVFASIIQKKVADKAREELRATILCSKSKGGSAGA